MSSFLSLIYTILSKYLKKSKKGLKFNQVDDVQWWLGDIFTLLCENKEIIDPIIYNQILDLKNNLINSISTILFFHTCFKCTKKLEHEMQEVILSVDKRIADLKLFLQDNKIEA